MDLSQLPDGVTGLSALPEWLKWIGVILGTGTTTTLAFKAYERWSDKPKRIAETHAVEIKNLRDAMAIVSELQAASSAQQEQINGYLETIRELKDNKIDDDRKLAGKTAVVEEQRQELRSLHEEMAEMRIELKDLRERVRHLETENDRIVRENLQLTGKEQL